MVAVAKAKPFPSGVALQIPQALAAAQDAQYRYQQQIPGRYAKTPPYKRIRDSLEVADQIEIGFG